LNADPAVMEFFAAPVSREQSDGLVARERAAIEERGWGLWAVENGDREFVGFVGLSVPTFEAHFTPAVEVGWRLARAHWGKGYATEAARAALAFGHAELELDEIVSFTAAINQRSRRVMERLGMTHDPADDFDHPRLEDGPLSRHVLYRTARPISREISASAASRFSSGG
jgi:ribosomal-protein-alanine N-acetyltransferase